jgi:hypothetical protein
LAAVGLSKQTLALKPAVTGIAASKYRSEQPLALAWRQGGVQVVLKRRPDFLSVAPTSVRVLHTLP